MPGGEAHWRPCWRLATTRRKCFLSHDCVVIEYGGQVNRFARTPGIWGKWGLQSRLNSDRLAMPQPEQIGTPVCDVPL